MRSQHRKEGEQEGMKRVSRLMAALGAVLLLTVAFPLHPVKAAGVQAGAGAVDQTLQAELESYMADLGGTYGVAALGIDDGHLVSINGDEVFPAASMYKLLVMYRVYQEIERGELALGDRITIRESDMAEAAHGDFWPGASPTVAEALEAMVTVSSNSAAYALTRNVGGWDQVVAAAKELGMNSTGLDQLFWSSPADMLRFFGLLADRSLVSPDASQQMIDLLLRQHVNDRIPALLPGDIQVAHKTGELSRVRNDGGIVYGPEGAYLLVVMSCGIDPPEAVAAESEISRMVYDRLGA